MGEGRRNAKRDEANEKDTTHKTINGMGENETDAERKEERGRANSRDNLMKAGESRNRKLATQEFRQKMTKVHIWETGNELSHACFLDTLIVSAIKDSWQMHVLDIMNRSSS